MRRLVVCSRPGVTLPELALVAWLFAVVLLGLARFATAQGRLAAAAHDRVRAEDLVRTTAMVLDGELRHSATADRSVGPDSVRLRAFRGVGIICERNGSDVRIRYRGVRSPNPEKDSALVVTDSATAGVAFPVSGVAHDDGCGQGYRLTLGEAVPTRGMVLVFETGSYYLTGGALRYRRGRGGRQPVTEAVLAGAGFRDAAGTLMARLPLQPDSLPRAPIREPQAVVRLLNPEQ